MLKSALPSVLSAFIAVCSTLLYQQWLNPNAATDIEQHVPSTSTGVAVEIDVQHQQQDQQHLEQKQQGSSNAKPPSPTPIDLAQALGLGRVLLSRGEPEEAALVYRVAAAEAVTVHRGDVGTNREGGEAQHGLGLALLAAGRSDEALEACREAERLDSLSSAASSCVGALLTGAGDTAGAIEALRRAVEKAVAAMEGEGMINTMRGRLGGALLDAGKVDEAISVMASGTTSDPHMAYNLGVAWQEKGETEKSILAYTRAVELAPTLPAPRVNLGAQLLQSGGLVEAEMVLSSAIKLAQDDRRSLAAAQANLGAVFLRSGRTEEALESYSRAVDSGAGRSSLMHVAKIHQDLGQLEQALEAAHRAVLEDGDHPLDASPLMQAGLILEDLGDIEQAADHFARVVLLDAENVEAMTHLGTCQQRLKRHHEAIESYLAASRLEPGNSVIYELLLSTVSEAKRATNEEVVDAKGDDLCCNNHERESQAAEDTICDEVPLDGMGKQPNETEVGRAAVDGVCQVASSEQIENQVGETAVPDEDFTAEVPRVEAPAEQTGRQGGKARTQNTAKADGRSVTSHGGLEANEALPEERGALGDAETKHVDASKDGNGPPRQDDEQDMSVAAAEAAATAAEAEAAAAAEEEETAVGGERTPLADIEISSVRLDSGDGRDTVDVQGRSKTKAIPGDGVGASVRQDTADIRRQSELLSKEDDDGEAMTTRGFFGKTVPEGSIHPSTIHVDAAGSSATQAGLRDTTGNHGAGVEDGGTARVLEEGASPVADVSITDRERVQLHVDNGSGDGQVAGGTVSELSRQVAEGATSGAAAVDEEANDSGGGEGIRTTTTPGAAQGGDSAQSGLEQGETVAAAVETDDNNDSRVAGRRTDEEAASAEPAVVAVSPADDDGAPGASKATNLPATAVEGIGTSVDTRNRTEEEEEEGTAVTDFVRGTADEFRPDGAKERSPDVDPVPMGEPSEKTLATPPLHTEHEQQSDAVLTALALKDSHVDARGDAAGSSLFRLDEVGIVDGLAPPSSAASAQGTGDGVSGGIDKEIIIAPANNTSELGGDGVAAASEAAVNDSLHRASEEEEMQDGERDQVGHVEAGDLPSVHEVNGSENILAAAEQAVVEENGPGKDSEESSTGEGDSPQDNYVDIPPEAITKRGTAGEIEREGDAVGGDGGITEAAGITAELVEKVDGREEGATQGDTALERYKDVAEHIAGAESLDAAVSSFDGDEDGRNTSSNGDAGATAVETQMAPASGEAGAAEDDPAAADAAPIVVTEEDSKRARAKAKLGMAKLQQGQAKKAVSLLEKAASIDPGWWGGLYYAALAHDSLGKSEEAAGFLVSALGVTPPTEEGEVDELATLSSKVLAALDSSGKGSMAEKLKAAMDASGLDFAGRRPAHDSSYKGGQSAGRYETPASRGGTGTGSKKIGGRSTSLGGGAGSDRASGGGGGGDLASRKRKEADRSNQFRGGGAAAAPGKSGGGAASENAKTSKSRWPFSADGGRGSSGFRQAGGGDGNVPGTNQGPIPGVAQRENAGGGGQTHPQPNLGRGGGGGGGDERSRDSGSDGFGGDRRSPSKPDVARRRTRGRGAQNGPEDGHVASTSSGDLAAAGPQSGGGSGVSPYRVDSKASAEDILASMGLKGGAPDLGVAGGGGRTPEEMMSAGSIGGEGKGRNGKKRGLFGGLFNRKGKIQ